MRKKRGRGEKKKRGGRKSETENNEEATGRLRTRRTRRPDVGCGSRPRVDPRSSSSRIIVARRDSRSNVDDDDDEDEDKDNGSSSSRTLLA